MCNIHLLEELKLDFIIAKFDTVESSLLDNAPNVARDLLKDAMTTFTNAFAENTAEAE